LAAIIREVQSTPGITLRFTKEASMASENPYRLTLLFLSENHCPGKLPQLTVLGDFQK
jgi:hypothetical protein